MDENIVRILASYGCKYMADDNKEMIEEIEAYVKKREEQLTLTDVSQHRELLLAYEIYHASEDDKENHMKYLENLVDTYLANNCG